MPTVDSRINMLKYSLELKLEMIESLASEINEENKTNFNEFEASFLKKINNFINNSDFYKRYYELDATQIVKIENINQFQELPLLPRKKLEESYPLKALSAKVSDLSHYSESVSADCPISFFYSRHSWFHDHITVSNELLGEITPKDIVVVASPYELSIAAQELERVFEILGATIISCGIFNEVCPWDRFFNLLSSVKPNVLVCSATHSFIIADVATKMGFDLKRDFNINKVINVSENLCKAKRNRVAKIWDATVFDLYSIDGLPPLGVSDENGDILLMDKKFYFEIIDIYTNQVLVEKQVGELVITSLDNEALPLIRYRTGELASLSYRKDEFDNSRTVLKRYGKSSNKISVHNQTLTYQEIENILFSSGLQDKYYDVEYNENSISIYMDAINPDLFESSKEDILCRFPSSLRDYVKLKAYTQDERELKLASMQNINSNQKSFNFHKIY
ncbi:phenylacetate--CoA ligase family protein [Paenibacillus donghaensis]|uniref:AMP-dependent synthetase/ligase domain-containing protein n=1 Tax=Paenibacillus donghaensis TaxID=414771 RepID=A0A2Z2KIJ7_9BACL|nr:phenylacetate--CoA ligase family protein [Paenibacillus donghaensis]ASA25737.1 hypothetical protein B9T62_36435 [Paenibacillus donghaensis]